MNTMTQTTDEMPLPIALKKATEKWPHFPVSGFRRAVERGVIPTRRSSPSKGARYYVRWTVLEAYWDDLKR